MRCPGWALVAGLCVAGLCVASTAWGDALDAPALSAPPAELLALARAQGGADTAVLAVDQALELDEHDAAIRREHWIAVVRDDEGADAWRVISARWRSARQDRPEIRGRVIAPDGTVAMLDPANVTEPAQDDPAARALQATLPEVPFGSVVEQEIVYHDHAPALAVGDARTVAVGDTLHTVVELSAPVARKARTIAVDLPRTARRSHRVVNGRDIWRYELGPLPDGAVAPFVGITTATSWSRVAGAVQAVVAPQVAAPVAWPAGLPRAATRETVEAIAGWLRGHVRGEVAAFAAPAPPGETIASGRGASSDVAVVWLALLRQAGIPADLVLTSQTPETVASDELPGAAAFDRVLVRARVAGHELWIAPDDELLRPGLLPRGASNRPALVVAAGTRALIRTPGASAADHAAREVRSFAAAEAGGAKLTVVTHETGVFEAEQRAWFRSAGPEIQRYFERDAKDEFAGVLERQTATGVDDVSQPLSVTLEIGEAYTVFSDREALEIYLYPRSALVKVPWLTRHAGPVRRDGFDWPVPHSYEIENRIAVPDGYTLPVPTGDRVRTLGTARLAEHQALDGRTLIVSYRFDTGKPHVTAAELATLQAELARLDAETLHLTLPLTAVQLADGGKPREAIAEAERLIRRHPSEALHHLQLSAVLLRVGAGEAARREARAAIKLAPGDAETYLMLGHVLLFDTLGQVYGFDWDRDGAIAAFRKARALAPRLADAAIQLSDALVRNRRGRYAEAGADLEGALAAARDAQLLVPGPTQAVNVVRVLVRLGKLAEARALIDALPADAPYRDAWHVALAAALDGPAAGIRAADPLPAGLPRTTVLDAAAEVLVLLGRYDAARGLAAETRTPAVLSLVNVTAHPAVVTGSADPAVAALDVILVCSDRDRASRNFWSAEVERAYRDACARYQQVQRDATNATLLSDSLQSHLKITVEGDADAWRVNVVHDASQFALYFALERGVAALLGDGVQAIGTAQQLDRLLEHGRDDAARRLADWLLKDASGELGSTMHRMWGGTVPRDHEQLLRLAGVLLADGSPARGLALLGRCAGITGDLERACHQAMFDAAFAARRWSEVVAQDAWFTARAGVGAGARPYWYPLSEALVQLGRFDDAERVLDDTLASHPDARGLGAVRAYVAARRGDVDEAIRRGDAVVQGTPTAFDLNQIAWLRLTENRDLDAALDVARRGVRRAPKDRGLRNTLAAIEAERGEPGPAMEDLLAAVAGEPAPRNGDWFVIGRIYEQLGLTGDAIAAYRRVTPDRVAHGSCYELAARRLTALHASH